MIQVENLTKKFGDITAVDKVSFEVSEGQDEFLARAKGVGRLEISVIPYIENCEETAGP
jgi:ABC-type branched-subunit amino acid transport system ATPase component